MKILIASDLHGSAECIEKLVKRIEIEKPEKILLLGDILYHGPRNDLPDDYDTKRSCELLNRYKDMIVSVRGNCDAEVDSMVLAFNIEAPHMILNFDGITIFATHGHYYNKGNLPPMANINVLLHGHTHVPAFEQIAENKYYINPGSLSIPKGGSTNSYMIYENRHFYWKDLAGNVYREESI